MNTVRRAGSCLSTLVGAVIWIVLLTLLLGPAIYLELAGVDAPGVVTGKREQIRPNDGFWTRQLLVDVEVATPDDAHTPALPIMVDAATFDAVAVGAPAMVHYVQNETMRKIGNFAIARLAVQPPFGSFLAILGDKTLPVVLGIVLFLSLITVWTRWRTTWLAIVIFGVLVAAALVSGSSWQPAPSGPLAATTATVQRVTRIDRVWGGDHTPAEDAVQPFNIVQLEFVPAGRSEPVIAVDLVDDGSVAGLREGAQLGIHYSIADPRAARLDGATRSYWWKNLRSFALIGGGLLVAGALSWVLRLRWAARRAELPGRVP